MGHSTSNCMKISFILIDKLIECFRNLFMAVFECIYPIPDANFLPHFATNTIIHNYDYFSMTIFLQEFENLLKKTSLGAIVHTNNHLLRVDYHLSACGCKLSLHRYVSFKDKSMFNNLHELDLKKLRSLKF